MRLLVLITLIALPLAGCDAVESVAGLDNVDVPLGSAGSNIPVAPTSTAYSSGSVSINQDIPGSPGVSDIDITQDDVTFTASAPRGGGDQGSCTLGVTLLISDVPAVVGSVVIEDDVVTAVTANYASTDYDRATLCEAIGVEENCPVGTPDAGQIRDAVGEALNSGSFTAGIVVDNPGDCNGTLDITEATFDLDL